jgi:uncharacterized protein
MQVNVSQLLKAPIGSVRNHEINGTVEISGDVASKVCGEVKLLRTNRGILVRGTLYTWIQATCSRCLSLFECPLTLNIEEEYFPVIDVVSGVSLSIPEEPGYFTIDGYHILDLTEAVRQYALLAKPMKPLCHEDCAGLCPGCGHNLNQGPCNCLPQEADPRWSELSKLALANHSNKTEGK